MKPKVLLLIKGLGLGGAERLLVDSLPFLNREQFDYHVGYLLPWKHFLVKDLERAGLPVHCLGDTAIGPDQPNASPRPWSAVTLLPRALGRLLALQRREQFDIIQADLPIAGILARLAGRISAVPVVYTEHNLQERYHPVTKWSNASTYSWNRCVLAVSEEVAKSIERAGLSRRTQVVTLPNSVPLKRFEPKPHLPAKYRAELNVPANDLVVGAVAVFRLQKRLGDWLRVAAHVAARRPNVTFLLVGDGPLKAEIQSQIVELGLSHRVRTPGFRPDGRRLMAAMDVYLMTSEFEGLPIALLEAMTLGKPVVSTEAGGVPQLLGASRAGLLAPIGATAQLADHVIRLLDDQALRAEMGRMGAAAIDSEYHVSQRVKAIENLYTRVLGQVA